MSTDLITPKPEILKPLRDEKGRLLPGYSSNPTGINAGRPRIKFISEALNQRLENAGEAEVLADKLMQHAKDGKPSVSLAAIDLIADRTEGKAIQSHRIEQSLDAETLRKLSDLADRLV